MGMVSSAVELSGIKFVFGVCLSWLTAAGETPSNTRWDFGWGLGFPSKGTACSFRYSENLHNSHPLKFNVISVAWKLLLEAVTSECVVNIDISELLKETNKVCVVGLFYREMEAFYQARYMARCLPCSLGRVEPLCPWECSPLTRDGGGGVPGVPPVAEERGSPAGTPPFGLCRSASPGDWAVTSRTRGSAGLLGGLRICWCGPGCPSVRFGRSQRDSWCFRRDTAAAGSVILLLWAAFSMASANWKEFLVIL